MVDWQDFLRHLIGGCFKICNNCDMKHHFKVHKFGFTLAEVLITLGIIGVVAALTIPTIVTKYRRQATETRLKKFYSVVNQAIQMSIAEKGSITLEDQNNQNATNSEYITNWYQQNITKYIKTLKGEAFNDTYYKVSFVDGSGFSSYMNGTNKIYIFYCLNFDNCNGGSFDGKNTFLFTYDKTNQQIVPEFSHQDINSLKQNCYNTNKQLRYGCAALIMKNNWKIPDDYPWIR